jgi:hypothetical protein
MRNNWRTASLDELRAMKERGEIYVTKPDAEEIDLPVSFWDLSDIERVKRCTEQFVAKLARVQPQMLDEPQAYQRACIRLGYETAIAVITAKDLDTRTEAL